MAENECTECLAAFDGPTSTESTPPAFPTPTPVVDDAASLLLMLSGAAEQSPRAVAPSHSMLLPRAQLSSSSYSSRIGGMSSSQPQSPSQSKRSVVKVDRVLRCGACEGCRRADCGRCPNCRDKPKFGGSGVKKQACTNRRCLNPTRTGGGQWAVRQPGQGLLPGQGEDAGAASDGEVSQDSTVPYSPLMAGRRDVNVDELNSPSRQISLAEMSAVPAAVTSASMLASVASTHPAPLSPPKVPAPVHGQTEWTQSEQQEARVSPAKGAPRARTPRLLTLSPPAAARPAASRTARNPAACRRSTPRAMWPQARRAARRTRTPRAHQSCGRRRVRRRWPRRSARARAERRRPRRSSALARSAAGRATGEERTKDKQEDEHATRHFHWRASREESQRGKDRCTSSVGGGNAGGAAPGRARAVMRRCHV